MGWLFADIIDRRYELFLFMIVNVNFPQVPIFNSDVIRPQKSPDSSPESTVIQNRRVAPISDVRVVQQSSESSNSNVLQDSKQDVNQGGELRERGDGQKQRGEEQGGANRNELLSDDELREVELLAQRDREVRAHEQAHLSVVGSRATSGASFSYTEGPNGKRYATGGEVRIDTSPVRGDPQATLLAAALIQRAAMAPAEPSTQDRQVAAGASAMAQEARAELSQQRVSEAQTTQTDEVLESGGGQATSPVSDSRDDLTKNRQAQLEEIVGTVVRGAVADPRGANLDYFL